MNKIYPLTAGLGLIAACAFDFLRTTLEDARKDRGLIRHKTKPTPVPEEDFETVVAPTG